MLIAARVGTQCFIPHANHVVLTGIEQQGLARVVIAQQEITSALD